MAKTRNEKKQALMDQEFASPKVVGKIDLSKVKSTETVESLEAKLQVEREDYFKLNEEFKRLRASLELEAEASQARKNQWLEQVSETEKWQTAYNDAVKSAQTISKELRTVKEELEFAKIELTSCTGEYKALTTRARELSESLSASNQKAQVLKDKTIEQTNAISIYKDENISLKDELIVVLEENELLKKTLKSIL